VSRERIRGIHAWVSKGRGSQPSGKDNMKHNSSPLIDRVEPISEVREVLCGALRAQFSPTITCQGHGARQIVSTLIIRCCEHEANPLIRRISHADMWTKNQKPKQAYILSCANALPSSWASRRNRVEPTTGM
jgi:hypothetical protein